MIIQARDDVISLQGSLVENQWPAIRSAVNLLLEQHPTGVIIDCSGLTDVSDVGAKTFLDASNYIQAQNARVVVAGLRADLLSAIRNIPGIRSQLVVSNTVQEARSSLQTGGMEYPADRRTGPTILVPLIGSWKDAVEFAIPQAAARKMEIHLLYVLQVPRTLPLGIPIPELEQEALKTMAEADNATKRRGVRVRKLITRARDLMEGAAKFASDNNPDYMIVAYPKQELAGGSGRCTTISTLCHEVPCEVIVCCVTG